MAAACDGVGALGAAPDRISFHKAGAAAFLRHVFRRLRARGRWRAGGLVGVGAIWRPTSQPRCCHGQSLAGEAEFAAQRAAGARCLAWYEQWVRLLRRLDSGRTPGILDLFCGGGGTAEGVALAGGVALGVDSEQQPSFVARFGVDSFVLGDALDVADLRLLVRRFRPVAVFASPPCEGYSTVDLAASSRAARLIGRVREVLIELGLPFIIENVPGARSHLAADSMRLTGQMFGLRTHRPRLFEGGGGWSPVVDRSLSQGGAVLERRCCLGARARFRRRDFFGRAMHVACCDGNIFAVQGATPVGGTEAQMAMSMGLDPGHMPFARVAKALPPAYMAYCTGLAAMHVVSQRFGFAPVSYDAFLAAPGVSRRRMAHLLDEGAGGMSPHTGVSLQRAPGAPSTAETASARSDAAACPPVGPQLSVSAGERGRPAVGDHVWYRGRSGTWAPGELISVDAGVAGVDPPIRVRSAAYGGALERDTVVGRTCPRASPLPCVAPAAAWGLTETSFRELDYTHAGDFDQWWAPEGTARWLSVLRDARAVGCVTDVSSWLGHNTFVHVSPGELSEALPTIRAALATLGGRARVAVVIGRASVGGGGAASVAAGSRAGDGELLELLEAGFQPVHTFAAGESCAELDGHTLALDHDLVALHAGGR